MTTYAIGDLQGCADELDDLLVHIDYQSNKDSLIFLGDLVNRGPDSLRALRRVKELGEKTLLGNHDLHLLAQAEGLGGPPRKRDTLGDILCAPDRDELLDWLRHQTLCIKESGYLLVHAGIAAPWSCQDAISYAEEVHSILRGDDYRYLLGEMYGDAPDRWANDLGGLSRIRFIINAFTRMRYCRTDGSLDMKEKGGLDDAPKRLSPWFAMKSRKCTNKKIVFGHWSTLRLSAKEQKRYGVHPLDTGCVWGDRLSAFALETGTYYSVPARSSTTKL